MPEGLQEVYSTHIKSIDRYNGPCEEAWAPMSVTFTLEDDIDLGRGDMLAKPDNMPTATQDVEAMICWMSEQPMQLNGKYSIKHTTRDARCIMKSVNYKINVNTLEHINDDKTVELNDIASVSFRTTQPLFIDPYTKNRRTGSLILIDEATNRTVGVGMVI